MSNPGGKGGRPERQALKALEKAVGKALKRLEEYRDRARTAEAQSAELGKLLKRFTKNEGEAQLLLSRLGALEEENQDLRGRLEKGRDGVERVLARVRFLEGQR